MKLLEIVAARQALPALLQIPVSPLVGYKLRKIRGFIEQESSIFYEEYNSLITKHGKPNGDGIPEILTTDHETIKVFRAALQPLEEKEVSCNLEKLFLEELGDAKVPTIVWDQFAPFISDSEE